jgi:ribosomal protein L20A (L18A)
MGTSGWDKFKTSRKRLTAVNAKESVHIDQASKEAVRFLTILLLFLLVLALLN